VGYSTEYERWFEQHGVGAGINVGIDWDPDYEPPPGLEPGGDDYWIGLSGGLGVSVGGIGAGVDFDIEGHEEFIRGAVEVHSSVPVPLPVLPPAAWPGISAGYEYGFELDSGGFDLEREVEAGVSWGLDIELYEAAMAGTLL
jgi:hypothetical protein